MTKEQANCGPIVLCWCSCPMFINHHLRLFLPLFRTTSKNGLLLYLGPDGTKIEGKEDWLSLELASGQVVFKYDLGSGPANIVCCQGQDFADGEWHQIRAER